MMRPQRKAHLRSLLNSKTMGSISLSELLLGALSELSPLFCFFPQRLPFYGCPFRFATTGRVLSKSLVTFWCSSPSLLLSV